MPKYLLYSILLFLFYSPKTVSIYASEHTAIGVSFERTAIFANQIDGITFTKLSISKSKWEKASIQMSLGFGISNNFNKSKLDEVLNGRVKAFELDLSLRGHFFNPKYPVDYYLILGLNIEALYWKYKEPFELIDEYGYGEYVYKDGTTGVGFYCGVGMASFVLDDLKLSLEAQPGLILLSQQTHNGFDKLLNDIYYLKFNFSIVYDPE